MFPVAQYETHENSMPYLTAVGNFTGNGHCFAAAFSATRVYCFDTTLAPDQSRSDIKIGQKITCIESVKYKQHDGIVIGTDNSIRFFDLMTSTQVFCTLIDEGATAVVIGTDNNIYVGSNCAILGYNFAGDEVFWTVTGDVVTAMCQITWDNQECFLAASDDLMIRCFLGQEAIRERRVKHRVVLLRPLGPNKYAIAFDNGSIALHTGVNKAWDLAAGGQVVGLQIIDYSGGGTRDIAFATAEGTVGVLDVSLGSPIISHNTGLILAGLHLIDLKDDDHLCLLAIGTHGSVRVFMPHRTEGLGAEAKREFDLRHAQPSLIKEKARLLLREYELTRDLDDSGPVSGVAPGRGEVKGEFRLGHRLDLGCVELKVGSIPPTPIQGTIIECPTTSGGDFVIFETNEPAAPDQEIHFNFPDDVVGIMTVSSFVSGTCYSFTTQYQKFFGFKQTDSVRTAGYAEFAFHPSLINFLGKSFILDTGPGDHAFRCCFKSLAGGECIDISSDRKKTKIGCDRVETASRIIQEYCDGAQIVELECRAHFPREIEQLLKAAEAAGETSDTQVVQKAEVAGLIANLKDWIVRIENAELIGQYQTLHQSVVECERLNEEIAREHVKRIGNRGVVSGAGGEKVNAISQKFAELRKGNARNTLLQLARKELQSRNFKNLAYLLEHGRPVGQQES
jgi:hypothetical protein